MGYTTGERQKHLIVTLAHYLYEGHEFDWTERAAHADPDCQEGEESHKLIVVTSRRSGRSTRGSSTSVGGERRTGIVL